MKRVKKLIGEKVYLSPIISEDAELFTTWTNDSEVSDFTGTTSKIYTYDGEIEWISGIGKDEKQRTFSICTINKDELIGNLSLFGIDYINRTCELGIFIGASDKRSKGLGEEAINLILDFGFNYLNLHSVYLRANAENKRAIRCYEKVGFKQFGIRREDLYMNGKYYNTVYMELLKSEYNKETIKNKVLKAE